MVFKLTVLRQDIPPVDFREEVLLWSVVVCCGLWQICDTFFLINFNISMFQVTNVHIYESFLHTSNGATTQYTTLTVTIHLSRKPGYYLLIILLPTVMLFLYSMLTFAVPCESGEKTVMLSYIIFLLLINDHLPKTSDYTPILCKQYICYIT